MFPKGGGAFGRAGTGRREPESTRTLGIGGRARKAGSSRARGRGQSLRTVVSVTRELQEAVIGNQREGGHGIGGARAGACGGRAEGVGGVREER